MKTSTARLSLLVIATVLSVQAVRAQYPNISSEVASESNRRKATADKLSDEAFAKALPIIKEWEAKGKPYLPGAAEPKDLPQAKIPSFPGAWGGGMYSFGGRGGKVFVVTNLNDSGAGSFREACEAGGPRIVVFNVAGIIKLTDRIRIRARLRHHRNVQVGGGDLHLLQLLDVGLRLRGAGQCQGRCDAAQSKIDLPHVENSVVVGLPRMGRFTGNGHAAPAFRSCSRRGPG